MSALLLQAVSVVLLRYRLGRTWLRRPVTILVLTSVVYQGVSPMLLSFSSIRVRDIYSNGIQQSWVDEAVLVMSLSMLAFTVAYLSGRPEGAGAAAGGDGLTRAARVLDWRFLALCCAPLGVLTYDGRGYGGLTGTSPSAPLATVLASTFFVIVVALTAFSFVLRKGPRWFLPALIIQSLLLAAGGERAPVIMDAVALIVLLCHAGQRPPVRQMQAAAVLTVIAVLAITGVRGVQGRTLYQHNTGLSARVAALAAGLPEVTTQPLLADAAQRLDGVDFEAAILQADSFGQPRLSPAYVPGSLLLVVPSAIWPAKLAYSHDLYPVPAEIAAFGLQSVNFIPGFFGIYMGVLEPGWLFVFSVLLGLLAAVGERWLLRSCSAPRLALLGCAVIAAASGMAPPNVLVTLRSGGILAVGLTFLGALHARRTAQSPGSGTPKNRRQIRA